MEKLHFNIAINAPRHRVWQILWDDTTYRQWTTVFAEGSHAESDWQEGSKILFLGPNGDGMVSRIARLVQYEYMSFEHLGEIKNGVEDLTSAETRVWAGSHENYTLSEVDGGTTLHVELEINNSFAEYFTGMFPKALEIVKNLSEARRITPFLWFDERIEEALALYTTAFPNSKILSCQRNGEVVFTAEFSLGGERFAALNGGPHFKLNPSISFFVACETEAEVDAAWEQLIEGGSVLMPLAAYPWSQKYGWLQDRFGLSWQLSWDKIENVGQKFTPSLLFVGDQYGKAEAALSLYTHIFHNSKVDGILRYPEDNSAAGTIQHAQFALDGLKMMVMDSNLAHQFQFNEAVSFVIHCETQAEVDYYWDRLTADGGQPGRCAWLKDKFGVSWQVVPNCLPKYLQDPDPVKAGHAMRAMLSMGKIEIAALEAALNS